MRVIALLSWWEESPAWLTRCVAGVARFADHLVAVDGAYGHVAESTAFPRSGGEQVEAIAAACAGAGIGYTIHVPDGVWLGDEVAKRSFLFRAGSLVADEDDWYFVVDSDEMVTRAPAPLELKEQLAAAAADGIDAGEVEWVDRTGNQPLPGGDPQADKLFEALTLRSMQLQGVRKFFRADPTLRVERAHYVYVAGPTDGPRYLWGNALLHDLEPCVHVEGLRFEHWSRLRQPARRKVATDYYALRDELELETLRPAFLDGVPEVEHV